MAGKQLVRAPDRLLSPHKLQVGWPIMFSQFPILVLWIFNAVLKKIILTLFCGCILCILKTGTFIVPLSASICPFSILHQIFCQYVAHILESIYWNLIDNCSWIMKMNLFFRLANADWFHVFCFLKNSYPLGWFISFIGNKLTLETRPSKDGIDIRQELLKFHSTYYSSNLMGLCVLGRGKKCHV